MKIKQVVFIYFLICICTAGCVTSSQNCFTTEAVAPQTEAASLPQNGESYLQYWNLTEGELSVIFGNELTTNIDMSDKIGENYVKLEIPVDKHDTPWASGWRIKLDLMRAVGQTETGDIVFQPAEGEPFVLCIYDTETYQIQVLMRNKLSEEGISALSLSDFDIYLDDKSVPSNIIEELWTLHVDDVAYDSSNIIEEAGVGHTVRLIIRECPTLQYELKFYRCSKYLYIENLKRNQTICVPLNMLKLNFE